MNLKVCVPVRSVLADALQTRYGVTKETVRVGDRWFTECELTGHPQVNHERPLLQPKDQELPQSFQSRKALPFQSGGQLGRIDLKDSAAIGLDSEDLQLLDPALQAPANRLHFGKFGHILVTGYWLEVAS